VTLLPLLAACASAPRSDYVPGGRDLPAASRALYRRAVALQRAGDADGALREFGTLCRRHPERLAFHLARLRLAKETSGPEAAAALYEVPPEGMQPETASVLAVLATLEESDIAGRRSILRFAVERQPKEALWRLCLADVELRAHDLVVARSAEERALGSVDASARGFEEARQILGWAAREASAALALDPELAEAHLVLGYIRTRRADLESDYALRDAERVEAGKAYEAALALDPASVAARVNLAENLLYFGRHDAAIRELERAAALAPGRALVWSNLGAAYWSGGREADAEGAYRKALELEPGAARTRVALADCLQARGNPDGALAELARARADAAGDGALLALVAFKRAAIYEYRGEYAAAVDEYREHVRLGGRDSGKARSRIERIFATGPR